MTKKAEKCNLSQEFLEALDIAGRQISRKYFTLVTEVNEEGRYAERVYCYELYHQLRLSFTGELAKFVLHGEVSKVAHPRFKAAMQPAMIPDFIVQLPGTMIANLFAIEVEPTLKGSLGKKKDKAGKEHTEAGDDIHRFVRLTKDHGYHLGVYLLFGEEKNIVKSVRSMLGELDADDTKNILLRWQPKPKSPFVSVDFRRADETARPVVST